MLRSETIFLSARDWTLFELPHESSTPRGTSRVFSARRQGRTHSHRHKQTERGGVLVESPRVCWDTQPSKCSRNECSMDAAMVLGGVECVREREKGTGVFTRQVGSCEDPSDNCTGIYTAPVKVLSGYSVY